MLKYDHCAIFVNLPFCAIYACAIYACAILVCAILVRAILVCAIFVYILVCIYHVYIDCNYNNFHKKNIKYL